jgi:hypothetical protein
VIRRDNAGVLNGLLQVVGPIQVTCEGRKGDEERHKSLELSCNDEANHSGQTRGPRRRGLVGSVDVCIYASLLLALGLMCMI